MFLHSLVLGMRVVRSQKSCQRFSLDSQRTSDSNLSCWKFPLKKKKDPNWTIWWTTFVSLSVLRKLFHSLPVLWLTMHVFTAFIILSYVLYKLLYQDSKLLGTLMVLCAHFYTHSEPCNVYYIMHSLLLPFTVNTSNCASIIIEHFLSLFILRPRFKFKSLLAQSQS